MQHPWDSRNVLVNLIIRYINIIYLSIFTRHSYIHKFLILVCRAFHSSRATGKLAVVNCIFTPAYFVFKNENIKLKVQYGFGLHTGLAGSHLTWTLAHLDPPSTLGISPPTWKWVERSVCDIYKDFTSFCCCKIP